MEVGHDLKIILIFMTKYLANTTSNWLKPHFISGMSKTQMLKTLS